MALKPDILQVAIVPHDGLTREERDVMVSSDMKDLAEQIARRPGRNAQTQLAAVRLLLEYTTPKPAQKIDVQSKSTVDTKIEVVLVSAKEGRRDED